MRGASGRRSQRRVPMRLAAHAWRADGASAPHQALQDEALRWLTCIGLTPDEIHA